MCKLKGKTVIYIAPVFFGYDEAIEQELKLRGAVVIRLHDRPFKSSLMKAFSQLFPKIMAQFLDAYYLKCLRDIRDDFDYVLVVNGQTISPRIVKKLKSKNPKAICILYMWDSMKNRAVRDDFALEFDKKYSFDQDAVLLKDFEFRPLFYMPRIQSDSISLDQQFLISFVGTAHSDRYEVIKRVSKQFTPSELYLYLYLQAPWVYWWYKLSNISFRESSIKDFEFKPIGKIDLDRVFNNSHAVLDVEHPDQTGLTIRTFDAIVAGKKKITTNKTIQNYDFFEFGNICVIDRLQPEVPKKFFSKKFTPYSQSILKKYSVSGWVDEVFDDTK